MLKRILLAYIAAVTLMIVSGCGDDNEAPLDPTSGIDKAPAVIGKRIKEIVKKDGNNALLGSTIYYYTNGSLPTNVTKFYISYTNFDQDSVAESSVLFTRNSNGNITEEKYYNKHGQFLYRIVKNYDSEQRLTLQIKLSNESSMTNIIKSNSFSYGAYGLETKVINNAQELRVTNHKYKYSYNNKGHISNIMSYYTYARENDVNGETTNVSSFYYNSNMFLVTVTNMSNWIDRKIWLYVYTNEKLYQEIVMTNKVSDTNRPRVEKIRQRSYDDHGRETKLKILGESNEIITSYTTYYNLDNSTNSLSIFVNATSNDSNGFDVNYSVTTNLYFNMEKIYEID